MTRPHRHRPFVVLLLGSLPLALLAGCEADTAAVQATIRDEDAPRVRALLEEDVARHRAGVAKAAERLAPGFAVEDSAERERQLRAGLRAMRQPPQGVDELVASPMSFLAAVAADGHVIARGAEPDTMKGTDFRARYPVVARALDAGEAGMGLGEFPADDGGESSFSVLFVAPVEADGGVVGAVVAGIPLWRVAKRLSTQLRLERSNAGADDVLWVFTTRRDRLFPPQAGLEIGAVLPDGETRRKGLADAPGGFTGDVKSYGKTYAWGVFPAPALPGDGVGFVVIRSAD